jgi:hypothetical protein
MHNDHETRAQLEWIDNASTEELLRRWLKAPPGDTIFQGAVGDYYKEVMFAKRAADPAAWTRASKNIGWD